MVFNEAPMLAVRVSAGELPPVEERPPPSPLVVSATKGSGSTVAPGRAPPVTSPEPPCARTSPTRTGYTIHTLVYVSHEASCQFLSALGEKDLLVCTHIQNSWYLQTVRLTARA